MVTAQPLVPVGVSGVECELLRCEGQQRTDEVDVEAHHVGVVIDSCARGGEPGACLGQQHLHARSLEVGERGLVKVFHLVVAEGACPAERIAQMSEMCGVASHTLATWGSPAGSGTCRVGDGFHVRTVLYGTNMEGNGHRLMQQRRS